MKYVIIAIVAFILLTILQVRRASARFRQLPTMTTEELKALFQARHNSMLFIRAAEELRKRGEDISFTYAYFLELAVSHHSSERLYGWTGLKTNFPEKLEGIDISQAQPNRETIAKLQALHEEHKDQPPA